MAEPTNKTPWHLWVVGVLALLFNAIGVFDFSMAMAQGADYMAKAGMTPEQIDHYVNMPGWITVVWAIGVFGAFLASVLLLLRRKLAATLFAVSLAAFVLNLLYNYVLSDGARTLGQQMAIASGVILVVLVFLTFYAWRMGKRGVLR
jgi:hypothetical protein